MSGMSKVFHVLQVRFGRMDEPGKESFDWVHIPVENEHLFRFKMNADSGLRVHRFRTPQCTYSDVR